MLSDNIRNYRKANHMSQDELAEKLDVTRQSISLWETGQTQPSLDKIVALAKLFNISTDTLLTGGDIKPVYKESTSVPSNKTSKGKKFIIVFLICFVLIGVLLATVLLWKNRNSGPETDREEKDTLSYPDPKESNDSAEGDTEKDIYGYFKNFVVQNGTLNGDYCSYWNSADKYGGSSLDDFTLYYWGDTDTVEFCLHRVVDDTFSVNYYLLVPKDPADDYGYICSYYYRDNGEPLYEARGTISAAEFTRNYPLNCTEYTGSPDQQDDFMEMSRQGICELLDCLKKFTVVEKLDYSFSDMGFSMFD